MEKIQLQRVLPNEIEQRSFEIITQELRERGEQDEIRPENEGVVKGVIHTAAEFDYVDSLCISEGAVAKGIRALQNGPASSPTPRWPRPVSTNESWRSWVGRFSALFPTRMWRRRQRSREAPEPPPAWRRQPP